MKTVMEFVDGLRRIREDEFTIENVFHYIRDSPVDPDCLSPFLFYATTHYTRNLVYRCDLFELIAICWEIGQGSQIHNHQNQNCWMAVPIGRLAVQNYELIRMDEETSFCELREANRMVMDPQNPSHVDPAQPIHSVLNLAEHGQRSASLHIYSRPYNHCLVYSIEKRSYRDMPLFYDTEYGRPVPVRTRGDKRGSSMDD